MPGPSLLKLQVRTLDFQDEAVKAIFSAGARISIDSLIKRLGSKAKSPINHALVFSRIQLYASQICKVKTLLSPETLVPIDSFYCAPRLFARGRTYRPKSSSDFREDHVLIEGVAGQGKSVLLRYLCARAITEQGKIALFYEMRRLDKLKPLITIVQESLHEFGLPGTTEGLKTLAVERDIELYLDGFDELDRKSSEKLDRDINYISINHPFIKIFVTSRPHIGLAKNSSLEAYRIETLDRSDIHRLIRILCPDALVSDSLIRNLDFHRGRALELLETPLLVTLLVAQYSQTQQLPEQLAEFYDNIFPVLFERHDSFKTPFVRTKHLGLTTHTYRKVFQQFCFGSLFAADLTADTAIDLARWAMNANSIDPKPELFLADICDISSLINEEGGHWSFIHNSIQEFYAASYILSGNDGELRGHSESLASVPNLASREQVFRFAREINGSRFVEFVELPFYEGLSKPLPSDSQLGKVDVAEWLCEHASSIVFDKNLAEGGRFFTIRTNVYADSPLRLFAPEKIVSDVVKIIDRDVSPQEKVRSLFFLPLISERLFSEAKARVQPYLEKRIEARKFVQEKREEGRRSNDFLASLLKKQPA